MTSRTHRLHRPLRSGQRVRVTVGFSAVPSGTDATSSKVRIGEVSHAELARRVQAVNASDVIRCNKVVYNTNLVD